MNQVILMITVAGLAIPTAALGDKDVEGAWIQGIVSVRDPAPGLWKVIYGHEVNLEDPVSLFRDRSVLSIEGANVTFKNGEHTRTIKAEFDPTKSPKAIDFVVDKDTRFVGVYEVKDGKLLIAIGHGKERPKEVEQAPGAEGDGKTVRIVYSKLKPPAK